MELPINTTALGVVLCVLAIAAAVLVAVLLRRRKFSRETKTVSVSSETGVTRSGGTASVLRQRLLSALRFRWTAFMNRNTPAGLLLFLERRGRRAHAARQTGETMRAFIGRMDPDGGLGELADALDIQYYGGGKDVMSARRCREMRHYIRRILRHG